MENKCVKHLFLRGNFQQDVFFDEEDKINVWNRLWLSAYATGTQILSFVILDNHLHITALLKDKDHDSKFMHHFRLSITQYHNRRYHVKGTVGTRHFSRAVLRGRLDIMDCICYHIRNVLHHGIASDFIIYPFSTAKFVYKWSDANLVPYYNTKTLPRSLSKTYLPKTVTLPDNWTMTKNCMIIPPTNVFRADILQTLFGDKENYMEILSHKTRREAADVDDPENGKSASDSSDSILVDFIKQNCNIPIPSMTKQQRLEAIAQVKSDFPSTTLHTLERIFAIPSTTIHRFLKKWKIHK